MDIQVNRQNIITFPNNPNLPDITSGIIDSSLFVSELLVSNNIEYGEVNANRFEASVFELPDVTGEKIQVYQIDGTTTKYIFTGYVDSCKLDEYGYYRDIIAYDILYKCSGEDYDIATWWSSYWSDRTESTLGHLLRTMLTYFSIPYTDTTLLLDDLEIKPYEQVQKMSLTTLLSLICQINMCLPNVNRQGSIEFITLDTPDEIDITDMYNGGNSRFESSVVSLPTKINIYNEEGSLGGTFGSGTNVYNVQDNMLLYGKTTAEYNDIAQAMYSKLCTTPYLLADIEMIVSDMDDIKLGTIVITSKGKSLVCEQEFSGPILIDQAIVSRGQTVENNKVGYNAETSRLGLQINELSDAVNNKRTAYLLYDNNNGYSVKDVDVDPTVIIDIPFLTNAKCYMIFHANVIFNLETLSALVSNIQSFDDGKVVFTFCIDDVDVIDFTPTYTHTDGTYTASLDYSWYDENEDVANEQHFKVKCKSTGCDVTIPIYRIHGYLTGDRLVTGGDWDGRIDIADEFEAISLFDGMFADNITDAVIVDASAPIPISHSDVVSPINLANNMLGVTIIDGALLDKCMFFTTKTNANLLTSTATVSGLTFINGEIITPKISNFTKVTTTSTGCAFYASFDDGVTWKAYSTLSGWVTGASMTATELENVPASAWANNTRIKAVIDTDASLSQILFEGGTL